MLTSTLKIANNENQAISLFSIEKEIAHLAHFGVDVHNTLSSLYLSILSTEVLNQNSKLLKLYQNQVSLSNVLDNLQMRLHSLNETLLMHRNHRKSKQSLLEMNTTFQQLKLEIDLFREMHFNVKRNIILTAPAIIYPDSYLKTSKLAA